MSALTSGPRVRRRRSLLLDELRAATCDRHAAVEAGSGLPGSIGSRDDYVGVLRRWALAHAPLERSVADSAWQPQWQRLGVQVTDHLRLPLLHEDLRALGAAPQGRPPGPARAPAAGCFGEALGVLYVLEGSALGGQVVLGHVRRTLGPVPSSFLDGATRGHPRPWQSLLGALGRYDADGGSAGPVVVGARRAFDVFDVALTGRGVAAGACR